MLFSEIPKYFRAGRDVRLSRLKRQVENSSELDQFEEE
jgi:hypothetical protein